MFNFFRSPKVTPSAPIKPDSAKKLSSKGSIETIKQTNEQQQIIERVEQAYCIAEAFFNRSFTRPLIGFKLRGKSAGTAHLQENRLRFNPVLLTENIDIFHQEVVPHEICHLIAYQLYGRVKPHGREWQGLMAQVFKLNPSTTHSLNVSSVKGKSFSYSCGCGPISLTIRRHNKVVRGETKYRCRRCKQELTKEN